MLQRLFRRTPRLAAPLDTQPAERKSGLHLSPKISVPLVLLSCMAGVVAISQKFLIHLSLRLDEAQSMWQTSHSFKGMYHVVAQDVHMPMYHTFLHLWQMYLGNSVETVRSMSLLFFLIAIPLFYVFSRQVLSRGWALFAVVLFSFSPFMNWYGNETRMYTLLTVMSVLSQIFFTRIIKYNKGWLAYGLVAMVGVYSHYFFTFTLMAQGIFFLCNRKKFVVGSFKKLAAVAVLAGTSMAPWLYYFYSLGAGSHTHPLLPKPSTVDFFNAFSQFSFGFQDDHLNTIIVSFWPVVILIGFFAIQRNLRMSTDMQYVMTAAFVPILLAYAISLTVTPFFLSRYMVTVVPPLTIMVVWFVSHYRFKLAVLVSVLMLAVISLCFVVEIKNPNNPVKEDYQAAAMVINKQAKPQDIVVLSAAFTVYPFQYYYTGQAQIATLPIWDRTQPGDMPAFSLKTMPKEVQTLSKDHQYVYLLLSHDQGYEKDIKKYYQGHYHQEEHKHFSDDLDLYVFRVGYDSVPAL